MTRIINDLFYALIRKIQQVRQKVWERERGTRSKGPQVGMEPGSRQD